MIKSTYFHKRRKGYAFMIIFLSVLILTLLTISPSAATVNSWGISPEEPTLGDTIQIKGSASPEEEVEVQVTFEKSVQASNGKYEYILEDVKIPEGFNNCFTVQANGASDLNVRVKMLIWLSKSSEASGNTATVTQSSVPPGTYQIRIDGDAKSETSTVNLKITAVQQIKANSDGDFSYSYNTKAIPPGDFEVTIGGTTKKVTLQQKETSAITLDSSQETESVMEQTPSETQIETEDTDAALNRNQSTEQGENKKIQKSQPVEKVGPTVDTVYILGGMIAAIIILILFKKTMK